MMDRVGTKGWMLPAAFVVLFALGLVGATYFAAAAFPPGGDPHGGYDAGTDSCGQCHTVHDAPGSEYLYSQPDQKETCYRCHDGSGASTDIRADFGEAVLGESTKTSFHPVPTATDGYTLECNDCHTPHKTRAEDTKLLRVSDGAGGWDYSPPSAPIGNAYCYSCHDATSTFPDPLGDQTSFEGGVHEIHGGAPASGIQCVLCHDPHGSDMADLTMQETTCYSCHNAATPNTNPDLPFDNTELEYAFSAAANDYDTADADGLIRVYHHPIGEAEQAGGARQVECASCHNSHLVNQDYSGSTSKISDPGDTRINWIVNWANTTTYTTGDISDFCVECHQSPTQTAPFSAGTWIPYDVRLTNDTAPAGDGGNHDRFDADVYFTQDTHGEGVGLACTACHDPHGSSNAWMLREYVIADGGAGVPAGTVGPRITGLDDTWTSTQRDTFASFCESCHNPKHQPGSACTSCHSHGGSKF